MRFTAFFMMTFISASEIREYPALPSHAVQGFPACRSSMGPLRNARATMAFASKKIALVGLGCHFLRAPSGCVIS